MATMVADHVDLLVVGCGLHAIIMAKTYIQVNPTSKLLIVDQADSLGGTWAKERLYTGLKTNNVFGFYELSDFPMVPEKYGAKPGGHIPGHVVHNYLSDVAVHYGIDRFMLFKTKVDSARLGESGHWAVQLRSLDEMERSRTVTAAKVVIATGLTSEPNVPTFAGQANFGGPIIHSKELIQHMDTFGSYKNIVILGGNKSSWDTCYGAAKSGSTVHMVMRPSGGGPSYLWPRMFSWGPFRKLSIGLMSATRLFSVFDPTLYGEGGPFSSLRSFLHRSHVGQIICQWGWRLLDAHVRKLHGFRDSPELSGLEPWITPFWTGNSLSTHNYETDWFDLVREGRITVHVGEVKSLSEYQVHLSNGGTLAAEALVCCTGWKAEPPLTFEPEEISNCFRLPAKDINIAEQTRIASQDLHRQRIYFDTLTHRTANAPEIPANPPRQPESVYQLHRMVIPIDATLLAMKNLAFIGMNLSVLAVVVAQAQALWITAYFENEVEHLKLGQLDADAVRYNTILQSVYEQKRRPKDTGGAAGRFSELVFDSIPYIDTMLRDLGMKEGRKLSWWKELTEAYVPADYAGLVDEWLQTRSARSMGSMSGQA